ncbi:hypothetical protein LguiB_030349 [Lonicera macranthoides]
MKSVTPPVVVCVHKGEPTLGILPSNWTMCPWLEEFPRQAEQVPCATTCPKGESPGSSWTTNGHHPLGYRLETWTRTLDPSGLAGFSVLGLVRPRGETEALYWRYDTDCCVVDVYCLYYHILYGMVGDIRFSPNEGEDLGQKPSFVDSTVVLTAPAEITSNIPDTHNFNARLSHPHAPSFSANAKIQISPPEGRNLCLKYAQSRNLDADLVRLLQQQKCDAVQVLTSLDAVFPIDPLTSQHSVTLPHLSRHDLPSKNNKFDVVTHELQVAKISSLAPISSTTLTPPVTQQFSVLPSGPSGAPGSIFSTPAFPVESSFNCNIPIAECLNPLSSPLPLDQGSPKHNLNNQHSPIIPNKFASLSGKFWGDEEDEPAIQTFVHSADENLADSKPYQCIQIGEDKDQSVLNQETPENIKNTGYLSSLCSDSSHSLSKKLHSPSDSDYSLFNASDPISSPDQLSSSPSIPLLTYTTSKAKNK